MKSLQNKPNTVAPGGDYPYGDVRDNPGNNTGTPVNRLLLGDLLRNIEKIVAESGVTPNELDDNEANGYQILEAMKKIFKPYKSIFMTVNILSQNITIVETDFPNETLTVSGSNGIYIIQATANIFPLGKTICQINHAHYQTGLEISPSLSDASKIAIYSYNYVNGNPAPLSNQDMPVEIRIYD